MKIITIVFSVIIVSVIANDPNVEVKPPVKFMGKPLPPNPKYLVDGLYSTRLDHFRPQDTRKISFPYKLNLTYYRLGGPLFFYINDLGEYITNWIEEGLIVDIALELGGGIVTSDHRYFHQSTPTETASFDDLQYLTVEHSLADIATLITTVRRHLDSTGNVILFGMGYGAKLAVWARQVYPHLIDGVWSSSGIFQPDPISFNFYNNLESNILYRGGQDCALRIENAFEIMDYLIENDENEYLQERMNLCNPVDSSSDHDIAMFFEYNIAFISDYIDNNHIHGIHEFCRAMSAVPNDPFNSYVRWVEFMFGSNDDCFDFNYENNMEILSNTTWNQIGTISGMRQWRYGQCTQLGYMKATSENIGMFPNRISATYQFDTCERIFGDDYQLYKLNEATRALIIHYGGRNQQATNIVFTNGILNPWVYDGITQYDGSGSYVYNMQFTSRGGDFDSIKGWDSGEVTFVKNRVKELITEWALA